MNISGILGLTFISLALFAFEPFPKEVVHPKDNPTSPAKVELGKILYFDTRLSKDNTVSCNTCHNVMGSGTDNLPTSKGINGQFGGRNSPTVWNSAFHSVQFWDGRAPSLEEQAKGPITNPIEMGMKDHKEAIERLKAVKAYNKYFEAAFGKTNSINIDNVAKALAAYERTLITPNSPYDKYLGGDKKALNEKQIAGMNLFQSKGCIACHSGPNFSGPVMPAGQGFYQKFPTIPGSEYEKKFDLTSDLGRYVSTKKDADKNMWRVPTLRNVALTGPYFHNGKVDKLEVAVKVMGKTQLGQDITDDEALKIAAFLGSLSGERPKQTEPNVPK